MELGTNPLWDPQIPAPPHPFRVTPWSQLTYILFAMVSNQLPQFKIPSDHRHLERGVSSGGVGIQQKSRTGKGRKGREHPSPQLTTPCFPQLDSFAPGMASVHCCSSRPCWHPDTGEREHKFPEGVWGDRAGQVRPPIGSLGHLLDANTTTPKMGFINWTPRFQSRTWAQRVTSLEITKLGAGVK